MSEPKREFTELYSLFSREERALQHLFRGHRAKGVTYLAWLHIIMGIVSIIVAVLVEELLGIAEHRFFLLVFMGAVLILLGYGLLRIEKAAWWLAQVFYLGWLVLGLVGFFTGPAYAASFFTLTVSLIFMCYLFWARGLFLFRRILQTASDLVLTQDYRGNAEGVRLPAGEHVQLLYPHHGKSLLYVPSQHTLGWVLSSDLEKI